jgi:pyruvate/2-oxoglutarate dehydrogenase complex dihydrolipoamide acyltransferase (E2) component
MTLGLTCDHRVVYGAEATAFLGEVRGLLEAPLALLVDADPPTDAEAG